MTIKDKVISAPQALPLLKWAGGKRQLLAEIFKRMPDGFFSGKFENYCEPFVGGAALFFAISHRPFRSFLLADINADLINLYEIVQKHPDQFYNLLTKLYDTYSSLSSEEQKEKFYQLRKCFNEMVAGGPTAALLREPQKLRLDRAAHLYLINKICYNGLYRLNSKGGWNTPYGGIRKVLPPTKQNIKNCSSALAKATLVCAPFSVLKNTITPSTFYYFDPPYRPLTKTATFNAYFNEEFDDNKQIELANLLREIDKVPSSKFLLSNSDPTNSDPNDLFFDELYKGFQIERIEVSRFINSKGSGRKGIREILVRN